MSLSADAGADQVVEYDDREHISLDASLSTIVSDPVYSWKLYGEEIASGGTPDPISLEPGTYTITLVITDGTEWDYDTVEIVVNKKSLDLIDLLPDKFRIEL